MNPKLRIVSWNINRSREAWSELTRSDSQFDVALLQEAIPPSADIDVQTTPAREESWKTAGGSRPFCAAVARLSDRVGMEPVPSGPLPDVNDQRLSVSRPGSLAAADIKLDGEDPITIVSLYGAWQNPREGEWIIADASVHRLISDLSYLVSSQRDHRIIAAGDLNILYGYGDNGSPYWRDRYATVFSRMAAIGIPFVGPQHPHGEQAQPWPSELPPDSKNVPTFRTRRTDPSSATRQLDYVFASESLRDRVSVTALNSADAWGPSDHCRILIDLY